MPDNATILGEKSFDRLVFFSDAVVAIALTLLAQPLLPIFSEVESTSLSEIWQTHAGDIFAFFLSFVVIASFWRAHRTLFDFFERADGAIVSWNMVWLFAIVFLPVATAGITIPMDTSAAYPPRTGSLLYIATMFVAAVSVRMIGAHGRRHLFLFTDEARERIGVDMELDVDHDPTYTVVSSAALESGQPASPSSASSESRSVVGHGERSWVGWTLSMMLLPIFLVITFILSAAIPQLGTASLLLLFLIGPIRTALRRAGSKNRHV